MSFAAAISLLVLITAVCVGAFIFLAWAAILKAKQYGEGRGKPILFFVPEEEVKKHLQGASTPSRSWPDPFDKSTSNSSPEINLTYQKLAEATARRLTESSQTVTILAGAVASLAIPAYNSSFDRYLKAVSNFPDFSRSDLESILFTLATVGGPVALILLGINLGRKSGEYFNLAAAYQNSASAVKSKEQTNVSTMSPEVETPEKLKAKKLILLIALDRLLKKIAE